MNSNRTIHSIVSGLIEYAERYADSNDEPCQGDCRKTIEAGKRFLTDFHSAADFVTALSTLVEAVEFIPLGIRGIKALEAAKFALGRASASESAINSRKAPKEWSRRGNLPACFDDSRRTVSLSTDKGTAADLAIDASHAVLAATGAALFSLITVASVPDGINPNDFFRAGGWLERVRKELQNRPIWICTVEIAVPPARRFSAMWADSFMTPGTRTVTGDFFTRDAGYETEDLEGIGALEIGETWKSQAYGAQHSVTRLHDPE